MATITTMTEKAERCQAAGNTLYLNQKYAAAVKQFKKAIKLDPTRVLYWSNLATCYDNLREWDMMQAAAQCCVDLEPTFVNGYHRLAIAHYECWALEDALNTIQRGLAVDPNNQDLNLLQLDVTQRMRIKSCYDKDVLEVPVSDVPFLGGFAPDGERKCTIPRDSVCGQLKRSRLPPLSKKYQDLSQYDKELQSVFETFFHGKLRIEWILQPGNVFVLDGYVDDDTAPVIAVQENLRATTTMAIGSNNSSMRTVLTVQNLKYHRLLTEDQTKVLEIVLIERFLAQKAAVLDGDFLVATVYDYCGQCNTLRLFKDACYLSLIHVDVMTTHGLGADIGFTLIKYAEALESAKLYTDAAKVYVEICAGPFFAAYEQLRAWEGQFRGYAGVAFKRAQDYISAEREYVASFRAANPGPNFFNQLTPIQNSNLENMMVFYCVVHRAVLGELRHDEMHTNIQKAGHILVGLLANAGCKTKTCNLFDTSFVYQKLIKPQYKKKKHATKAIINSIMAPTIEEYHTKLFQCMRASEVYGVTYGHLLHPGDTPEAFRADFLEKQKKNSKESSRKKTESKVQNVSYCSYCNTASNTILACPCNTVRYCGKSCQVAQWPVHKKHCPHLKEKKKASKKK